MSLVALEGVPQKRQPTKDRYRAPTRIANMPLRELLARTGRGALQEKQLDLLRSDGDASEDVRIYYAGNFDLLCRTAVSIVGTRDVTDDGRARARRLARELTDADVVIVSGLAKGVDTVAHQTAIENGRSTVGVVGTPLDKAYPAENAALQEEIYRQHLLISPFSVGERVFPANFPKRNRVMAAVSDATVIVEASDTSGTLHQAAECQRLQRWLFIMKSVADNPALTWPRKFIGKPRVAVATSTTDIIDALGDS